MVGPNAYEYLPLPAPSESTTDFRILLLLPGEDGDEINCTLEVASPEQARSYEALSYTW